MIALPQSITASRLRLLLLAALALIIILGGVIFYLGYTKLGAIASETGEQVASAKQSETTIERLEATKKELDEKKDIIARVSDITADSQNYAYQDRLVNDLTVYARKAHLTIKNISFASQGGGGTGAAPVATAPPGGGASEGSMAAPAAGSSLKKATVDITLENPLDYKDLLNFLHYIEQNLTKLKVSRVSMTKSKDESVTIDILNLEVYLK